MSLVDVRVTGERQRKWHEAWRLAPDLGVYTLDNGGKQYELAITVEGVIAIRGWL